MTKSKKQTLKEKPGSKTKSAVTPPKKVIPKKTYNEDDDDDLDVDLDEDLDPDFVKGFDLDEDEDEDEDDF